MFNHYHSVHYPLSLLPVGIGDTLQLSKQVSKSFKCVSMYILFLVRLKVGGRSFFEGEVGAG